MDNLIGNKPPLSKCSYYRYQIKNLEVLYIRDTNAKRTYVAMAVDCGSKYDTKPGLAHLLEHLLFISPEQEQANDLGIGLDSLTCPIKDNTQQDIADSDVLKAPSQDDGEGCTKEDLDVAKLVCDALNNREDSSQDTDSAPPKINDFDSFLNIYNGDSNAYTTEDETVYHY